MTSKEKTEEAKNKKRVITKKTTNKIAAVDKEKVKKKPLKKDITIFKTKRTTKAPLNYQYAVRYPTWL